MTLNSFDAKATLTVGDRSYEIYRLDALQSRFDIARLPFSLKILLDLHLQYNQTTFLNEPKVNLLFLLAPIASSCCLSLSLHGHVFPASCSAISPRPRKSTTPRRRAPGTKS